MDSTIAAGSETLDVSFCSVEETLSRYHDQWKRLAFAKVEVAPFMDPHWVCTYRDICAPDSLRVALATRADEVVGLALLEQHRQNYGPWPIRVLRSTTFDWLSRYDFLAKADDYAVLKALWHAWLTSGTADVVHLILVAEGSPSIAAGMDAARELGWKSVTRELHSSPWRSLPVPPETWDLGLKSKFKSNLRNRERRLAMLGSVHFEVIRGADHLPAAMETFYRLEAAGWKSENQSAISQQPSIKLFYDRLVGRVPIEIWVPTLFVQGKAIAAQFIRVCGTTLNLLKVGYDPAFSAYSPGQLLMSRTIAYGMEQGMTALDFLGADMAWKQDWNPELRGNVEVILTAPTWPGRYVYWSGYGLKDQAKKIPGMRALVRRLWQRPPGAS